MRSANRCTNGISPLQEAGPVAAVNTLVLRMLGRGQTMKKGMSGAVTCRLLTVVPRGRDTNSETLLEITQQRIMKRTRVMR